MKKFHQLTEEQQIKAITFAKNELTESLSLGIIEAKKNLSEKEITRLAEYAAEGSYYGDDGKPIPFHALGGCV